MLTYGGDLLGRIQAAGDGRDGAAADNGSQQQAMMNAIQTTLLTGLASLALWSTARADEGVYIVPPPWAHEELIEHICDVIREAKPSASQHSEAEARQSLYGAILKEGFREHEFFPNGFVFKRDCPERAAPPSPPPPVSSFE
jgi:hypothetical protein